MESIAHYASQMLDIFTSEFEILFFFCRFLTLRCGLGVYLVYLFLENLKNCLLMYRDCFQLLYLLMLMQGNLYTSQFDQNHISWRLLPNLKIKIFQIRLFVFFNFPLIEFSCFRKVLPPLPVIPVLKTDP